VERLKLGFNGSPLRIGFRCATARIEAASASPLALLTARSCPHQVVISRHPPRRPGLAPAHLGGGKSMK
jgi:hypothetical protein